MTRYSLALVAMLVGGSAFSSARAAAPVIYDGAAFFSKPAIDQAMTRIQDIYRRYKVDIAIETFPAIPDNMKDRYNNANDKSAKKAFFRRWAENRASDLGVKGVYLLICKSPPYLYMEPDESVRKKAFTLDDRDRLAAAVRQLMGENKFDAALAETVKTIGDTVAANEGDRSAAAPAQAPQRAPGGGLPAQIGGGGIGGWICFGIIALLVFWLILGVVRAFTGGSRGGGYGPGYGGGGPAGMPGGYGAPGYGGGGGGGGGFFSSLIGGMFGAAAGNWMYDSFFRGGEGHSSSWGGQSSSTGYGGGQDSLPADQPGAGVFGNDTGDGGGGSFGDDSGGGGGGSFGGDDGGGSFGGDAGGGDFGGGGDSGGGGDFGGGGGDGGGGDF